jgi:hypothetical protein
MWGSIGGVFGCARSGSPQVCRGAKFGEEEESRLLNRDSEIVGAMRVWNLGL